MRKRAENALHAAGYYRQWDAISAEPPRLVAALVDYAAANPGLDARDYGFDPADFGRYSSPDWRAAYMTDSRMIMRQWQDVKRAARDCWLADVTDQDIIDAAPRAFSGRLEIDAAGNIDYCPGQYQPSEYRAAAAAVLRYVVTIAKTRSRTT